jgi:putative transposase
MSSRKVPFENNEYYHVYNRGVEKRRIFLDEDDYAYFCHILTVFNNTASAQNTRREFTSHHTERSRTSIKEPLVKIERYTLMPNHFHLVIQQTREGGASLFLQRLGVGFTHYFNKKYSRSGVLFQGKSKSKHIHKDKYYQYLKMYLDLNPIDLIESGWKKKGIKNKKKVGEFLHNYKWSFGQETHKWLDDISPSLLSEIEKIESSLN